MKINSASVQHWIVPIAVLVAWELFGRLGMLPRYLSTPGAILEALWELTLSGELVVAMAASLYRVSLGFALGTAAGIVVGLGAGMLPGVRHFFDPLVSFLYAIVEGRPRPGVHLRRAAARIRGSLSRCL